MTHSNPLKAVGVAAVMLTSFVPNARAAGARVIQAAFTPAHCARLLLGPEAETLRTAVVRGLAGLDGRRLVPVNYIQPQLRLEMVDPDYAESLLDPEATVADLEQVRRDAKARLLAETKHSDESTKFTKPQAKALGIHTWYDERVDFLEVALSRTPRDTLQLETFDGARSLGAVELEVGYPALGYQGDIHAWTYERVNHVKGKIPPLNPKQFILDHGVVALRPVGTSRFVFVTSLVHLDSDLNDGEFEFDVYFERECSVSTAEAALLQILPRQIIDGFSRCLDATGLRLKSFTRDPE